MEEKQAGPWPVVVDEGAPCPPPDPAGPSGVFQEQGPCHSTLDMDRFPAGVTGKGKERSREARGVPGSRSLLKERSGHDLADKLRQAFLSASDNPRRCRRAADEKKGGEQSNSPPLKRSVTAYWKSTDRLDRSKSPVNCSYVVPVTGCGPPAERSVSPGSAAPLPSVMPAMLSVDVQAP